MYVRMSYWLQIMWNIQANIYLDEEAKQKDPVIGDLLERVMNKYVDYTCTYTLYVHMYYEYFMCLCMYIATLSCIRI